MRRWLGHRRSSGSNARGPTFPWPLSPTVPALFFPWLSCAVLRVVPGLGRSGCRVAIVVRSVKLVHAKNVGQAYNYTYAAYIYAYAAYVSGTGSYDAFLYEYVADYYAAAAFSYASAGDEADAQSNAYYAYYYGYYGQYDAYQDYAISGGASVYSYYAYYDGYFGQYFSYFTALGY